MLIWGGGTQDRTTCIGLNVHVNWGWRGRWLYWINNLLPDPLYCFVHTRTCMQVTCTVKPRTVALIVKDPVMCACACVFWATAYIFLLPCYAGGT